MKLSPTLLTAFGRYCALHGAAIAMLPVDAEIPMNLGVAVLALSKGYVAWKRTSGPTVLIYISG
jgi:hypothetical protein